MKHNILLQISFFGSFHQFCESPLMLEIPVHSNIQYLKDKICETLSTSLTKNQILNLLNESVIATETEILPVSFLFLQNEKLVVLPPVCGG